MLEAAAPEGASVEVAHRGDAAPGLMDTDHPVFRTVVDALSGASGLPVVPMRTGGTLPIFSAMTARGMPTILTGFTLPDDAIHSPNERMWVPNLGTGVRAAAAMLTALAE